MPSLMGLSPAVGRLSTSEQLWWGAAAVLLGLLALSLTFSLVDKRLLDGVGVWAKPMKFQLSLAIHLATLALVTRALSGDWRTSMIVLAIAIASVAATAFEIAYIMVQAARQQHSHFNVGTPFYALMYTLMAVGAVVITLGAGALGAIAAIDRQASLADATRHGIVIGLIGGTVLTLVVAFTMGGRLTRHVGTEPDGTSPMPLFGWSRAVGDLRVPHFFATHMMQAVPLGGWFAANMFAGPTAIVLVWVFAVAWTGVTLLTFRQALYGAPFPF